MNESNKLHSHAQMPNGNKLHSHYQMKNSKKLHSHYQMKNSKKLYNNYQFNGYRNCKISVRNATKIDVAVTSEIIRHNS